MSLDTREAGTAGGAYIELLLIFPILCIVAFAGLEYARGLNQLQIAVSASREIANLAFRDCIADAVQAKMSQHAAEFDQGKCLAAARDRLINAQQIEAVFPGLEFAIAVYSYNPVTNAVSLDGAATYGEKCISKSPDCVSKYNQTEFSAKPALRAAAVEYGTLLVAEVYIPYNGLLSGATPLFHFTPKVIYGTTIL